MRLALLLVVAASLPACTRAPRCPDHPAAAPAAATFGETFTVDSTLLGERRVINVYVPPGYQKGADRYPVLYLLDGGMREDFPHIAGMVDVSIKNAVIRPVIVVGIENTERRRDLVPATSVAEEREIAPHAGGDERFRNFLRDELQPQVAERYRTNGESALIGESLAGLFVVEVFLLEPALFDAYIAVDPSVWWNEQALVRGATPRLAWWSGGPKTLLMATSSEARPGLEVLTTALRIYAPAGVTWSHEELPDERHGTIFPVAALRAIRTLYAPPPTVGDA